MTGEEVRRADGRFRDSAHQENTTLGVPLGNYAMELHTRLSSLSMIEEASASGVAPPGNPEADYYLSAADYF